MNKRFLALPVLAVLALASCTPQSSSPSSSSTKDSSSSLSSSDSTLDSTLSSPDSSSSSVVEQLPDLKTVMTNLASLRNYTYTLEDEIFDVTTTFRYTEKAYYYNPSKEEHGGTAYGYAQSNDDEVFEYTIVDGEIVPEEALRNTNGQIVTDLWNQAIISFYDFNIEAFPSVATEDNTYEITDSANKLLFSLLAGYGDAFVSDYITVTVEVLSENTIRSVVHFEPDNPNYVGDCIGVVGDVGTTTIPEIEAYLEAGLGPKEDTNADFVALLEKLKATKKYHLQLETGTNTYGIDFNDSYYLQQNMTTDTTKRGALVLGEAIYSFTMTDSKVAIREEITYSSSTAEKTDLWHQFSFNNFSIINLSDLALTENEDGTFTLEDNTSVLSTFLAISYPDAFFPSVNETDYVLFSDIQEDGFRYRYHSETLGDATGIVSGISTHSNPTVEAFIEANKDFDPEDLTALQAMLDKLSQAKNYTIDLTNNFSAFVPALSTGNALLTFTEDAYYYANEKDDTLSLGYREKEDGIYSFKLVDDMVSEETKTEANALYGQNLFASFSDYDYANIDGKRNFDDTYTITDSSFIQAIGEICRLDASFSSTVSSMTLALGENSLSITGKTSFYGSCNIDVYDIGTTTLNLD